LGRAEAGQSRVGKAAARQGRARGLVQSGAGAAGALHMVGRAAAACENYPWGSRRSYLKNSIARLSILILSKAYPGLGILSP
jgi:hypothetical protein